MQQTPSNLPKLTYHTPPSTPDWKKEQRMVVGAGSLTL